MRAAGFVCWIPRNGKNGGDNWVRWEGRRYREAIIQVRGNHVEPRAPSRILVFEPQTITSNSYVAFTLDSTDLPDSGRTKGRPNKYAGPVCCPSMGANRVALSDG